MARVILLRQSRACSSRRKSEPRAASVARPLAKTDDIIPFPQVRRAAMIGRAARRMRSMRPRNAELYLIRLLELVQDELLGASVPQDRVDEELIALAIAIKTQAFRGAMWSSPGGRR